MNRIIVRLNRLYYNKNAIEEALDDFKNVCSGAILNDKFEVELKTKKNVKWLEDEFCNYTLGLMKNKCLI